MNNKLLKGMVILVTVLAVLMMGAVTSGWLDRPASAQDVGQVQPAETVRRVTVTGTGRAEVQPDMAVVRLGVHTEAEEAQEALEENNVTVSEVISATQGIGIAEEDIQTADFRVEPVFAQPPPQQQPTGPPNLTGYRVINIVEVTVRDLDSLGELLDTAVQAGSNRIEGVSFRVTDREQLLTQAREEALNSARQKAEQLVTLADAELGEVLTIEMFGESPPPIFFGQGGQLDAASAVPIEPGTQFIETTVSVTWRIE